MEAYLYEDIYRYETNHWWYRVRRRLVHILLDKYLSGSRPFTILDIGCGGGKLNEELRQYGNVIGVDPSPEAVHFCQSRGLNNIFQSSIESYATDQKFDCVIALDVLEHCEDDSAVVQKLHSFLKPNGIAIVFVPALKTFWGPQDIISHHYRRYTRKALQQIFQKNNFQTLQESYFNFLLAPPIWIIRKLVNLLKIKSVSEIKMNHPILNKILLAIFSLEIPFLKVRMPFPFGVSLLGVYKKIPLPF
ncbi:MAG TPA: class I SAM-dependent methyltransferase [Candidatus Paceibacterota bacterium]